MNNFSEESLRLLNLQAISKEVIELYYDLDKNYYYCYRTTNRINNKNGENKLLSEGTDISEYLKDGWSLGRDYGRCPECGCNIGHMGQVKDHFDNCSHKDRFLVLCKELNTIKWVMREELPSFINSGKWNFEYFQRRVSEKNGRFIYACPHCLREFSGQGAGFTYHFGNCKLRNTENDKWKDLSYYSELDGKYRKDFSDETVKFILENNSKYKNN